jgi:META domain
MGPPVAAPSLRAQHAHTIVCPYFAWIEGTKGLTRFACGLVAFVFAIGIAAAPASEPFPFSTALMLDAAPMRGSKRIPMIEIQENGMASIDLWCASARAQATVGDNSITIAPGDLQSPQCDPERQSRDEKLLAALAQVTKLAAQWRAYRTIGRNPAAFPSDDQLIRPICDEPTKEILASK